jgi:hypothetical protein
MHLKGDDNMDFALTAATWAWLLIPMPMLIVLSVITYFTETYFTENKKDVTYSVDKGELV